MGNRTGSPPSEYDEDEETDNQPDTDETTQTGITDSAQTEPGADEPSDEEPEDTEIPDEPQGGGGGVGGSVVTPTPPETKPPEDTPEEEPVPEDGHETEDDNAPDDDTTEPEERKESDEQDDVEEDEFEFIYGDIVHDCESKPPEDESPINFVIVTLPDEIIAEWEHGEDETLTDRNPGYPPTDDVIITVEKETLDNSVPDWDEREEEIPVDQLDEGGIEYTAFPSLRLILEEPSHLRPQ